MDFVDSKRTNSLPHTVDGGCPELESQAFPFYSIISLSAQFLTESLELPGEFTEALDVYTKDFQIVNKTELWFGNLIITESYCHVSPSLLDGLCRAH